jgi:hypothetical protein
MGMVIDADGARGIVALFVTSGSLIADFVTENNKIIAPKKSYHLSLFIPIFSAQCFPAQRNSETHFLNIRLDSNAKYLPQHIPPQLQALGQSRLYDLIRSSRLVTVARSVPI